MSGRNFELWQPLLALAAWVEDHGADNLLSLMQDYAEATIESAAGEQTPDCDEALLRILADAVNTGQQGTLTPGELLEKARETDHGLFERWTPQGIGRALIRYGVKSTHGKDRTYRNVGAEQLRLIEQNYDMDLGMPQRNVVNDGNDDVG